MGSASGEAMETLCNLHKTGLPFFRHFLEHAIGVLKKDDRVIGATIAGSLAENRADAFSDIDLVIAVEPDAFTSVMDERRRIAASLGKLIAAFTGEHVNEPRLLICLYDDPLLHVDLKFVPLPDAVPVVDTSLVLWDRDGRLTGVAAGKSGRHSPPDMQWIEDRFWVWVHYIAGKIGRGEFFEAIESLSFLRVVVLAPIGFAALGTPFPGIRHVESKAPELAEELKGTLALHDAQSLWRALDNAIALYRRLREEYDGDFKRNTEAEKAVLHYVRQCMATESC